MHTVKYCKEQKRSLIVLKHPPYLIGHPKTCGNAQLISEADTVFENDNDTDLVIIEMNRTNSIQMTLG
jgi:predicted Rossmann fold nucleotide-binding protein DprA/Smf involved in DNA uptake